MTQILIGGDATPANADVDANFAELYEFRELVSSPGYTAATPSVDVLANGRMTVGQAGNTAQHYLGTKDNAGATFYFGIDDSAGSFFGAGAYGRAIYSEGARPLVLYQASAIRVTWDTNGNQLIRPTATPPALSTNGEMVFNLTSNTNLRISVRGSDGTTRVANITLA